MAKVTFSNELCKGCGLCVVACPKKIVALSADNINAKGFQTAEVTDMNACIACAFCAIMCPDVVIQVEK
jgi:2-oxoglutarate ferredoxin oxidoreductase subunit delta